MWAQALDSTLGLQGAGESWINLAAANSSEVGGGNRKVPDRAHAAYGSSVSKSKNTDLQVPPLLAPFFERAYYCAKYSAASAAAMGVSTKAAPGGLDEGGDGGLQQRQQKVLLQLNHVE